jgi:hypothetical protein
MRHCALQRIQGRSQSAFHSLKAVFVVAPGHFRLIVARCCAKSTRKFFRQISAAVIACDKFRLAVCYSGSANTF